MGTVYRATDIKLGRDVAIKVLPDAFAQDADRVARFTREAQGLAALNHPKHRRPFMASKTARWWLDDEACFQVMRYTLNKGGVLRGGDRLYVHAERQIQQRNQPQGPSSKPTNAETTLRNWIECMRDRLLLRGRLFHGEPGVSNQFPRHVGQKVGSDGVNVLRRGEISNATLDKTDFVTAGRGRAFGRDRMRAGLQSKHTRPSCGLFPGCDRQCQSCSHEGRYELQ